MSQNKPRIRIIQNCAIVYAECPISHHTKNYRANLGIGCLRGEPKMIPSYQKFNKCILKVPKHLILTEHFLPNMKQTSYIYIIGIFICTPNFALKT